jgi:hypothetical protein
MTAKNEERLLKLNLEYHFALGLSKAYIYFDDATDGGPPSIENMPGVDAQESVKVDKFKDLVFLNKFTENAEEHHTARQCLNTYDATLKCREDGIDWLISIDADELIIVDKKKPVPLTELFDQLYSGVDLIHFDTREAVQQKIDYKNVFAEETLYKSVYDFKRKFERPIKDIEDPYQNKKVKISYWMGQFQGKSAIRVNSDLIPKNVHRYQRENGGRIKQVSKGLVLHFHAYDKSDFKKKFTNFKDHPDHFIAGSDVGYIKKLWRDIVNSDSLDQKYIDTYFENNILFTKAEIKSMNKGFLGIFPRKQSVFEEILSVKKVFESLDS